MSALHNLLKSLPDFKVADAQCVYFVQAMTDEAPIKIGISWDVYHRFHNLRTASPFELELLGTITGGKEREQEIHRRFAHLRMRGEWFRPAPELLAFIDEVLPAA